MMRIPLFLFFLSAWAQPVPSQGVQEQQVSSYNSFREQVGFCRMQSFFTTSRSSSGSVPMFLDGRISFGVGLSSLTMKDSGVMACGMCLNVTSAHRFLSWDAELTRWLEPQPPDRWFLAMVFDECTDPVCGPGYLDFDIYSETQPVQHGNPYGVEWYPVPCPVLRHEYFEYILCTAQTCHQQDPPSPSMEHIATTVRYWSLTIRNTRVPLCAVWVLLDTGLWYPLRLENAWVWDTDTFDLSKNMTVRMLDQENKTIEDTLLVKQGTISPAYHGGVLLHSYFVQN